MPLRPSASYHHGLRSYTVAHHEVLLEVQHKTSRRLNNRAENSHRPMRSESGNAAVQVVRSGTAVHLGARHDQRSLPPNREIKGATSGRRLCLNRAAGIGRDLRSLAQLIARILARGQVQEIKSVERHFSSFQGDPFWSSAGLYGLDLLSEPAINKEQTARSPTIRPGAATDQGGSKMTRNLARISPGG